MTDLIDTVQLQEIDAGYVELFDFTLPSGTILYLFKGLEDGTESVYFPNKAGTTLNEYLAVPLELSGISISSSGVSTRPTLSIANIPVLSRSLDADETTLYDEGIYSNEDLLGTVVEYRTTLTTHLKSLGDAAALPIEFPQHKFVLDRVSSENNIVVAFELATVFDIEGVTLPFRQINGRYCPWEYQGHALGARGGCTWPLDSHGVFYDKNDSVIAVPATYDDTAKAAGTKVKTITSGHTQIWEAVRSVPANKNPISNGGYWKRLDVCGKLISSCKVRFQGEQTGFDAYVALTEYGLNDIVVFEQILYVYINATASTGNSPPNATYWSLYQDTTKELPFGGFPGTRKFK